MERPVDHELASLLYHTGSLGDYPVNFGVYSRPVFCDEDCAEVTKQLTPLENALAARHYCLSCDLA